MTSSWNSAIVLVAALACSRLAAQWSIVDTTSAGQVFTMDRLSDGSYTAIGAELLHSIDDGLTWTHAPMTLLGVPFYGIIYDASFTDEQHGLAAGTIDLNNEYVILSTADGGSSWTPVYNYDFGGWPRYLNAIQHASLDTVYACGTYGKFVRSYDGGNNWSLSALGGGLRDFSALFFCDPSKGIAAAEGYIYRTTDAGNSWTLTILPSDGACAIASSPTGSAFLACDQLLARSEDQGVTWISVEAPFEQVTDIWAFSDDTLLVATLFDGMYVTRSGGLWWDKLEHPADTRVNQVYFEGSGLGIGAGSISTQQSIIRTSVFDPHGTPMIGINYSYTGGCGSYDLVASTYPDTAMTINWLLDGQPVGTEPNVAVSGLSGGSHALTLEYTIGQYSGSANESLYGNNNTAHADAGPDLSVCFGHFTTLSGTATGTVAWSPAAGLNSPNSPTTRCGCPGPSCQFVLHAYNNGCHDYDTVLVFVGPDVSHEEWETVLYAPETYGFPLAGQMVDPANGFALGRNRWSTHDGGASWTNLGSFANAEFDENTVGSISMADPFYGYYCGDGGMARTVDGWESMVTVSHPEEDVLRVHCLNADHVFAICHDGVYDHMLCESENGGLSWDTLLTVPGYRFFDMLVVDQDTLFVGYNHNSSPTSLGFARSYDGGANWEQFVLDTALYQTYNTLARAPNGVLFVGGDASTQSGAIPHAIARSTDNGTTWTQCDVGGSGIHDIEFVSTDTGYATSYESRLFKTEDGGYCWVVDCDTLDDDSGERGIALFPGDPGGMYLMATTGYNGGTKLMRTAAGALSYYIGFAVNDTIVCSGAEIQLASQCFGHDSLQWYVDGSFLGNDPFYALETMDPGPHALLLLAFFSGVPDSVARAIIVDEPLPVPAAESLGATCWDEGTATLVASGVPDVEFWYWLEDLYGAPTNYAAISSDTASLHYINTSAPDTLRFQVRAESANGCFSPWSDPILVALPEPPLIGPVTGPDTVCTLGVGAVPVTVEYSIPPVDSAVTYTWYSLNTSAVQPSGPSAVVEWPNNQNTGGSVWCVVEMPCGASVSTLMEVAFITGVQITDQPDPVMANEGSPWTMSAMLTNNGQGMWYHNGVATGQQSPTYSDGSASAADQGWYHWEVDLADCGILVSDSAYVTVSNIDGISDHHDKGPIIIFPNPANDEFRIGPFPPSSSTTFTIFDGLGRIVQEAMVGRSAWSVISVKDLADGLYRLKWAGEATQGQLPFTVHH